MKYEIDSKIKVWKKRRLSLKQKNSEEKIIRTRDSFFQYTMDRDVLEKIAEEVFGKFLGMETIQCLGNWIMNLRAPVTKRIVGLIMYVVLMIFIVTQKRKIVLFWIGSLFTGAFLLPEEEKVNL